MGAKQNHNSMSLGTNRRQQYASNHHDDRVRTEEQLEAAMDVMIQQAHSRLLERATGGLLTWMGDQIIPGPAGRRVRVQQVVVEAEELMNREIENADAVEDSLGVMPAEAGIHVASQVADG